jgi:hypothetical protein
MRGFSAVYVPFKVLCNIRREPLAANTR